MIDEKDMQTRLIAVLADLESKPDIRAYLEKEGCVERFNKANDGHAEITHICPVAQYLNQVLGGEFVVSLWNAWPLRQGSLSAGFGDKLAKVVMEFSTVAEPETPLITQGN